MQIRSTNWKSIERRAWQILKARFLPSAKSPDKLRQLNVQVSDKASSLDVKGLNVGKLRSAITSALALWDNRENLQKRDLVLLAAAMLYFLSPVDALPDLIPALGYLDDVLVVTSVVSAIWKSLTSRVRQAAD